MKKPYDRSRIVKLLREGPSRWGPPSGYRAPPPEPGSPHIDYTYPTPPGSQPGMTMGGIPASAEPGVVQQIMQLVDSDPGLRRFRKEVADILGRAMM